MEIYTKNGKKAWIILETNATVMEEDVHNWTWKNIEQARAYMARKGYVREK